MSAGRLVIPLSLRLAAVVLVAAVLPVLGAGLLTADQLELDARAAEAARLQNTARLGAGIVSRFAARGRDKLTVLAHLLGNRALVAAKADADQQRLVDQLDAQVDPPGLYLSLQYYENGVRPQILFNRNAMDVQLAQRANNDPAQGAFVDNIALPPVLDPLTSGQPFVGAVAEQHLGFTTVPVSAPVRSGDRTAGVVVGYLDLRDLVGELAPLGPGLRLRLLDRDGTVMVAAGSAPAEPLDTHAEHVAGAGWRFEVAASLAEVLGAAATARQRAWNWTLLAGTLALLLAAVAAAFIRRPIAAVTRAAQAMAGGDLGARVRLARRDEIGALGAAFDRMAAALQQLDAAKSDFVATVSHELRTPLTSMRLSLGNLLDGVLGELQPAQQQAMARMAADVARLERIVRDTLLLARLEAGIEQLALQSCDLGAAVATAAESLRTIAAARGIELVTEGAGRCRGDAALLAVLVGNLLDNAVKFSPDGGVVAVELAAGRLVVRDRGPGFATDRPFEPFVQGATAGVKNPGVGLGLAIAARIVKLHGGSITAASAGGGIVTVLLPEAS